MAKNIKNKKNPDDTVKYESDLVTNNYVRADELENEIVEKAIGESKRDKLININDINLKLNNDSINELFGVDSLEEIKPRSIDSLSTDELRRFKRTGIMPK